MYYDVEKLVGIVCDMLEAETADKEYNRKIRKEKGYPSHFSLWVPDLEGEKAYRLGKLTERCDRYGWMIRDVCVMLDVDQSLLIAAVKSMQRKEHRDRRWRGLCLTCQMRDEDQKRLARFLSNDTGGCKCRSFYRSTGRRKAWCT